MIRLTGGANGRVLSGRNNNWLLGYHSGAVGSVFHEGWMNQPSGNANTNWHVFTSAYDGTNTNAWQNRSQIVTNGTAGTQGPNGFSTSGHLAASEFSNADVAEIVVFSRVLTTAEREQVWTYLESKYGL